MYNKDKLRSVLTAIKNRNHKNLVEIIDHGVFPRDYFSPEIVEADLKGAEGGTDYYYVIQPRYYALNRRILAYSPDCDHRKHLYTVLAFLHSVADGLDAMHNASDSEKIVHYDFKPDNIMFDYEKRSIVIIDLGGAGIKRTDNETKEQGKRSDVVSAVAFTRRYMAPEIELFKGKGKDYSDYYSLGQTIMTLLNPNDDPNLILPDYYNTLYMGLIYYRSMQNTGMLDKDLRENRWDYRKVKSWCNYAETERFDKIKAMDTMQVPKRIQADNFADGEYRFNNDASLEFDGIRIHSIREFADTFADPDKWNQAIRYLQDEDLWEKQTIGTNLYASHIRKYANLLADPGDRTLHSVYFEFLCRYRSDKDVFAWPGRPYYKDYKNEGKMVEAVNLCGIAKFIRQNLYNMHGVANWKNSATDKYLKIICEWMLNGVLETYVAGIKTIDGKKEINEEFRQQLLTILSKARGKEINKGFSLTYENKVMLDLFIRLAGRYSGYNDKNLGDIFHKYEDYLKYVSKRATDVEKADELVKFMDDLQREWNGLISPWFVSWEMLQTKNYEINEDRTRFSKAE